MGTGIPVGATSKNLDQKVVVMVTPLSNTKELVVEDTKKHWGVLESFVFDKGLHEFRYRMRGDVSYTKVVLHLAVVEIVDLNHL